MRRLTLGVLGSGKGSNFVAIQRAIESGACPARVALVIADNPEAGILARAVEAGVPARFMDPGAYRTRLEPERELEWVSALKEAGVDLVVLAGFMRLLKKPMIEAFPKRIINIHPSLLPKYPGLEAWAQALAAGESSAGCTVHYVDSGMDTGEIIEQRSVPVLPGDTPETLHARIQEVEHQLYPEVIARLAREMP
jgi:phosphoribosylglycinamide formyltransferase-1